MAFIRQGVIVQTTTIEDWQRENVQVALRVGQPDEALRQGLAAWGTILPPLPADKPIGRIRLAISHEDQIPALAQWLLAQNYTLYELSPLHLSLEERFMQIMGKDAPAT